VLRRRPHADLLRDCHTWLARLPFALVAVLLASTAAAQADDPAVELSLAEVESTISQAQELAQRHRFQEVIDLLRPLAVSIEEPEASYAISAELGRALFHLGEYRQAHDAIARAVRLHPDRVETALYLEATFYLTGQRENAMSVFREVLKAGSDDLYLAVTLPGERSFLAEPEVWDALAAYTKPVEIDLERFQLMGVRLDQPRSAVIAALGADPADPDAPVITARAGPKLIWAFGFDKDGRLEQVTVEVQNLVRYTPYRPHFSNGIDWQATPAAALKLLGPPARTTDSPEGELAFDWELAAGTLTLVFGQPLPPRPPPLAREGAVMVVVRLARAAATD